MTGSGKADEARKWTLFRIVLPRPVGLGIYVRDDSRGIGVIGRRLRSSIFHRARGGS